MSDRITIKHLKALADRLNKLTASPAEYSTKNADGHFRANVGHFYISQAYGGYNLERVVNESGGVSTPINYGHIPARELFNLIRSFINGIEFNGDD